jgi:hypothetical protein
MKITKVRFTGSIVAFRDDRMPVKHHFHNAALGLTIEVRYSEYRVFVYGMVAGRNEQTKHAGSANGQWLHSTHDLYQHISTEIFRVADELGIEAQHCWPFIEQLPVFTENGVDIAEALELAEPIKDLLARGAPPSEVVSSLNTDRDTIEFVLGTKLPPQRRRQRAIEDPGVPPW